MVSPMAVPGPMQVTSSLSSAESMSPTGYCPASPRGFAAAQRDDLRGDGHGRLLGALAADVQANGRVDARQLLLGAAGLAQLAKALLIRALGAHRTDVAGLGLNGMLQRRKVELGIVGHHHNRA